MQSLGRVFGGFAVAALLAIPLGLAMGTSRAVERNVDPLVESFRPIAAIAILPLAILWFGTGTAAAVFIVAYAAFFPIVVNTVAGVKRVDPTLLQAAATMGVAALHRRSARSSCPARCRRSASACASRMGVAWTAIVAAELAVGAKAGGGGSGGIGQMMFVFYAYSIELNRIIVCMIAVGVVALAARPLLRAAACALRDAVERAMNAHDPQLRIEHAGKRFPAADGKETVAVRTSRSTSRRASSSCIVGPSGCGKTTVLNMLAGLELADLRHAAARRHSRSPAPAPSAA